MILVSELRQYIADKKQQLPGVNSSFLVVEKDELTRYLGKLNKNENQIMVAVMPDARTSARDEDNVKMNTALAFMFLEKTDYSESKQDEWLQIFERTQETALEFTRMILDDMVYGDCGFNRYLNPNNISIEPVSGLSSCNGWSVDFFFDMPF